MKADSFGPPGRRGEERGWGSVELECVVEVVEEAGGERRKPPDGESAMLM